MLQDREESRCVVNKAFVGIKNTVDKGPLAGILRRLESVKVSREDIPLFGFLCLVSLPGEENSPVDIRRQLSQRHGRILASLGMDSDAFVEHTSSALDGWRRLKSDLLLVMDDEALLVESKCCKTNELFCFSEQVDASINAFVKPALDPDLLYEMVSVYAFQESPLTAAARTAFLAAVESKILTVLQSSSKFYSLELRLQHYIAKRCLAPAVAVISAMLESATNLGQQMEFFLNPEDVKYITLLMKSIGMEGEMGAFRFTHFNHVAKVLSKRAEEELVRRLPRYSWLLQRPEICFSLLSFVLFSHVERLAPELNLSCGSDFNSLWFLNSLKTRLSDGSKAKVELFLQDLPNWTSTLANLPSQQS